MSVGAFPIYVPTLIERRYISKNKKPRDLAIAGFCAKLGVGARHALFPGY